VAFADAVTGGVFWRHLDPRVGGGGLQLPRPSGLGPGVEVIDGPSGREPQRELVRRLFGRRAVVNRLEDRPASRIGGAVLLLGDGTAGNEVVAERFAPVGRGLEEPVRVEPRLAFRAVVVARPLDA